MSQRTNAAPDAQLAALDRLVGTWKVTGGAEGTVTYRWMEGGHFLIQDVNLEQYGESITGMEVIGRERPFGAEQPSEDIKSRFYDSDGNTLDYVYEPKEDGTVIIWGGAKGSPAYATITFSPEGDTHTGKWVWPGGGYEVTATRVEE